eukprot:6212759-Pleurochrysis_carterae.AAC.2
MLLNATQTRKLRQDEIMPLNGMQPFLLSCSGRSSALQTCDRHAPKLVLGPADFVCFGTWSLQQAVLHQGQQKLLLGALVQPEFASTSHTPRNTATLYCTLFLWLWWPIAEARFIALCCRTS